MPANDGDPAVRLAGVHLANPAGGEILRGVDWVLPRGGIAAVVGPSGAGKTQILRLLNRLGDATSGDVHVLGQDIREWDIRELRTRVVLVPQQAVLSAGTVRANLRIPVDLGVISESELSARLPEALQTAQLPEELLERETPRLSGGERHRVAMARALLLSPEVLLLDEPTAALDAPTAAALLDALRTWHARASRTLIVVTHRIEDARRLDGQVLVLMEGQVEEEGSAQQVLASPRSARTREFVEAAMAPREHGTEDSP